MATSQNGFPALSPGSRFLHLWQIPEADRHFLLRNGSAGYILAHWALYFHEKVEPLDTGVWDDWGFAFRPIRGGSTTLSNHASGTAEDLNATQHVLGKRGTFRNRTVRGRAAQIVIRARMRWLYRGCIRWGGDYKNRADEMHFEINRDIRACERVAKRLLRTPRGKRVIAANPSQRAVIFS